MGSPCGDNPIEGVRLFLCTLSSRRFRRDPAPRCANRVRDSPVGQYEYATSDWLVWFASGIFALITSVAFSPMPIDRSCIIDGVESLSKASFRPLATGFRPLRVQPIGSTKPSMPRANDLQRVMDLGVVAILRSDRSETLIDVAETLLAAGVNVIEVTFTVPAAHQVIEKAAAKLGDRVLLGAGTVLDPETARIAILSGAQFIVAPNTNTDVIEMCRRYDKLAMPGALTPTEIVTAWQAGADVVKIFPSEVTGPRYLKALKGPLPQVRMMPTGGVTLETAADYLKAGACALGMGGTMMDPKAIAAGEFKKIEATAKQLLEIVRATRAEMQTKP